MIVGKIEFDVDRRRGNGRWFDQWIAAGLGRGFSSPTGPSSAHGHQPPMSAPAPLYLPSLLSRQTTDGAVQLPLRKSSLPPSFPLPFITQCSQALPPDLPLHFTTKASQGNLERHHDRQATVRPTVSPTPDQRHSELSDHPPDPLLSTGPTRAQVEGAKAFPLLTSHLPGLGVLLEGQAIEEETDAALAPPLKRSTSLSSPIRLDIMPALRPFPPLSIKAIAPLPGKLCPPARPLIPLEPRNARVSNRRTSMADMCADLDDLERALEALSPRALKSPSTRASPMATEALLELLQRREQERGLAQIPLDLAPLDLDLFGSPRLTNKSSTSTKASRQIPRRTTRMSAASTSSRPSLRPPLGGTRSPMSAPSSPVLQPRLFSPASWHFKRAIAKEEEAVALMTATDAGDRYKIATDADPGV